mgnify:CR=1 FL=1
MALPKIETPTYKIKLQSIPEEVSYRPFLVKEEKLLMIASETGDEKNIMSAMNNIIKECTFNKIDVSKLPVFDIELLFLNIRGKSVGEQIKVQITCPDDEKTRVEKEIDINEIKIQVGENHTDVIEITDSIKTVMKYPSMKEISSLNLKNTQEMFKIIPRCIKTVYDGEKIIEDFTEKEAEDFVSSFNTEQFQKIQSFFETMPKVKHDIRVENPNTKVTSTVTLEGLQSFF